MDRFAAWVHETDETTGEALIARGYTLDTTTLAMGMEIGELDPVEATAGWDEYLRCAEIPPGLLEPEPFHVAVVGGASAGMAFDHDGDCGVYNVGTLEPTRRRGLATAVTARLVHDARERGCLTASLQSTPMAERLYARVGFRGLGRYFEYVRSNGSSTTNEVA